MPINMGGTLLSLLQNPSLTEHHELDTITNLILNIMRLKSKNAIKFPKVV